MMKRFLVLSSLMIIHFSLQAQHQFLVKEVPIFKSAPDSIAYTTSQATFQKMVAGQTKHLSADSVLNAMRTIGERSIIGKRKTYHASPNFFPFDSTLTRLNESMIGLEILRNLRYYSSPTTNSSAYQKLSALCPT